MKLFKWVCAGFFLLGINSASAIDLDLSVSTTNSVPKFKKYLQAFPLLGPMGLTGLAGRISIATDGHDFAQALVSVNYIPAPDPCPDSGAINSYSEIKALHHQMTRLAAFIIKQPTGVAQSQVPTQINLPTPVPISGCIVVILDGSSRSGGDFTMTSNIVAHLSIAPAIEVAPTIVGLDDEFCFGRKDGCERATLLSIPGNTFMRVIKIPQDEALIALYGNISDSTFGGNSGPIPWEVDNDYYVYRQCSLPEGISGPSDFYHSIPSDAVRIYSSTLHDVEQADLNVLVDNSMHIALHSGDCFVHLVRSINDSRLGAIDAESQIYALVKVQGR